MFSGRGLYTELMKLVDPADALQSCGASTRERVLASARDEILRSGILGLKVADVAANAHFSVSVIYRHFGDRDGLLAAVLGDLYEEVFDRRRKIIQRRLPVEGPLTLKQVVRLAPSPSEVRESDEYRLRLQILAVSATNPTLEKRLSEIAQRRFVEMLVFIKSLRERLPEDQPFDDRVFTVMLVNQLLYYNVLLGPHGVDDEDYFAFLEQIASGGADCVGVT
jgi:AcrR family transcriptional regulator